MSERFEYSTRDLHSGSGFDLKLYPYMPVSNLISIEINEKFSFILILARFF